MKLNIIVVICAAALVFCQAAPTCEWTEEYFDIDSKQCTPLTDCPPGTQIVSRKSYVSDRTCEPCDESGFAPNINMHACRALSVCLGAQVQIIAPSPSTDRICGLTKPCADGKYESIAATRTSSRQCSWITTCRPSQYELTVPTPSSNRVCHAINLDGSANNNDPSDLDLFYRVTGDIYIGMSSANVSGSDDDDFTQFSPEDTSAFELPILSRVGGSVRIEREASISAISLPSLSSVEEIINVHTNPALHSFAAPALVQVAGLLVHNNPLITSVEVQSLQSARVMRFYGNSGALTLIHHPALLSVSDHYLLSGTYVEEVHVSEIKRIGLASGNHTAERGFEASSNALLTALPLSALTFCGVELRVSSNPALLSLELPKLLDVEEAFTVTSNPSLTVLSAPALRSIGSAVSIYANVGANSISLPLLKSASGIVFIAYNIMASEVTLGIEEITGIRNFMFVVASVGTISFPNLRSIGSFAIFAENEIAELKLPQLEFVVALAITSNDALTRIDLPSLTLAYYLNIFTNELVEKIDLSSLIAVGDFTGTFGGSDDAFDFSGMTSLASVELPSLEYCSSFGVTTAPAVTYVHLPALTMVYGSLSFSDMDALTSLTVPSLHTIESELNVFDNAAITFANFAQLISASKITIEKNPLLTTLLFPALFHVDSQISLCGNQLTLPYGFPSPVVSGGATCRMNNDYNSCAFFSTCPALSP
jgi:hypothetical protein